MSFLYHLENILQKRKLQKPQNSYATKLFFEGRDRILKKIGEEAGEVIIGAKNSKEELIYESADLLFHLILLLVNEGITLEEIENELKKRHNAKT